MATYLIDYENPVGHMFINYADGYRFPNCCRITDWVKEELNKKPCTTFWETVKINEWQQSCYCNKVILFFSQHCHQANLEETKAKCTQNYKYVANGVKNGLDFQLTTYLGSLIYGDTGSPTDSRFYIVSGDKGFGSALHFWQDNNDFSGLSFELLSNKVDFCKAFMTEELHWSNIYSLLYIPNFEEDLECSCKRQKRATEQCTEIIAAFFQVTDKNHLHNEIRKIVGNGNEYKKIYRLVRPLFDRYQKVRE